MWYAKGLPRWCSALDNSSHRRNMRCRVRDAMTPSPARRDNPQRPRAANRPVKRQLPEIRLASDRLVEKAGIAPPRDLDRAKAAQVLGHILRVEQFEAARDQPRHQVHQRHFRGVAGAMKHALAEEGAAEADTIEAADKVVIVPDLDAMVMPESGQPDVEVSDALVDPGVLAAGRRRGAAGDDRFEGGGDGDGEGVGAHRAREP